MASSKISALTALTSIASGDLIPLVDISDSSMAASGTTKYITRANFVSGLAASGANSDITSLSGLTTPLSVAQGGTGAITLTSGEFLVGAGASAITSLGSSGSGNVVRVTSATLVTPILGAATATSINGLTITSSTGTLTLVNGSSLITSGANSVTLTSTNTTNVTLPTTGTLATLAGSETLSGKTLTEPKIADTGFIADGSGNEQIKFSTTSSAVNEITVKNAATGTGPEIQATGGDTDIDLELSPKGTGGVLVNGTASSAGYIKLAEDTDNGTNYIAIKAPTAVTSNTTLTLPDGAGSSGNVLSTNGSGTLSWATSGGSTTGWIEISDTWTRTGNFTFTVATDLTTAYRKGTKVRYKDGGSYEYGYVESSSYGAPNTTVTLVTNADYTMAAATITEPAISYSEEPQGFPEWFTFTTTFAGFSADPSTTTIYFKITGLTCTIYYIDGSDGTSNATTTSLTMPVAAARNSNHAGWIGIKDNSSISSTPGHLTTSASSKTFSAWKSFSQGGWTGSGAKNIFIPELSYRWT